MDITSLYTLLRKHNIDTNLYSSNKSKSVEQLHNEIMLGESVLTIEEDQLIRQIDVLCIMIKKPDSNLVLREKWQQHAGKDPRSRYCLLAEKMLPGEDTNIKKVVVRALDEELESLGIVLDFNIFSDTLDKISNESYSQSYPGLKTRYNTFIIQVTINNLPETDFITTEYIKGSKTDIRLTTAWEWVTLESKNFDMLSVKEYINKYSDNSE